MLAMTRKEGEGFRGRYPMEKSHLDYVKMLANDLEQRGDEFGSGLIQYLIRIVESEIFVKVTKAHGGIRVGIDAPPELRILRDELVEVPSNQLLRLPYYAVAS